MPLIKSKSDKAFKKNVAAEVNAGKPVKQAVAIAYSTKRAAKKAAGGPLHSDAHLYDSDIDYYDSLSGPTREEEPEDTTPRRVAKAEERRKQSYSKKVNDLSQKFYKAKKSGDSEALKKVSDRWSRVQKARTLEQTPKLFPKHPEMIEKARKEWSENIGKGKPAPFKSGGKAKSGW